MSWKPQLGPVPGNCEVNWYLLCLYGEIALRVEVVWANFIDTRSRQEPILEETRLVLTGWILADSKYLSHMWAFTRHISPWVVVSP